MGNNITPKFEARYIALYNNGDAPAHRKTATSYRRALVRCAIEVLAREGQQEYAEMLMARAERHPEHMPIMPMLYRLPQQIRDVIENITVEASEDYGCETVDGWWDCECEHGYMHIYSDNSDGAEDKCIHCGATREWAPDSRRVEVIEYLVELIGSGKLCRLGIDCIESLTAEAIIDAIPSWNGVGMSS